MADSIGVELFYVRDSKAYCRVQNRAYVKAPAGLVMAYGVLLESISTSTATFVHQDEQFTLGEGEFVLRNNTRDPLYVVPGTIVGLLVTGNIDINNRPCAIQNGETETVLSFTHNDGTHHVVLPTVLDNPVRIVDQAEAITHYQQTGLHFGKFGNGPNADTYSQLLQIYQDSIVGPMCGDEA